MSRIVVKVGSNVLTRKDGTPDITSMSSLVDQIMSLREHGHEVVLVSSGAVACGRSVVKPLTELDDVQSRQLFSAVGQIRLMNLYSQFFDSYGITAGQVLTQKDNFLSETSYQNQRNCMLTMLSNGVVPIINENDTASLTELMFTDNDELSGLIATMLDADVLILLTNVDGIFTGDPRDPSSKLIERIAVGEDASHNVVDTKSGFGRGGMASKCRVASRVAGEGIKVVLANGERQNVLLNVIEHPDEVPHTVFEPAGRGG